MSARPVDDPNASPEPSGNGCNADTPTKKAFIY
jgi:hypothetical protein